MRFPTMWYVRQAKSQISLRICTVGYSEGTGRTQWGYSESTVGYSDDTVRVYWGTVRVQLGYSGIQ